MAVAGILLAAQAGSAEAQRTGDRARLVFTVSGALVDGQGLWAVDRQPISGPVQTDTLVLQRGIQTDFGVGFSGAYFPAEHLGFTADAFLLGVGYSDTCRPARPIAFDRNAQVCDFIDTHDRPASAVTLDVGLIYRVASREFISPFVRGTVGLLFANQSPLALDGVAQDGEGVAIYLDPDQSRVTPSFALGLGTTVVLGKAYHLRWEVRDHIVRIDRVTGPTALNGALPPNESSYKHLFSVLVGLDVILERQRGRRY
ncbi:MAG: hypothetical protein L0214_07010 [candidate division NC10 bacterium]|nr:hypothetical protein [candidate division NC10 bacterium]